ncbi:hypothetical protein [Xenorhabdus bovienii]|uniref:hypothetical protein n=1 Tax=Xenorhabdus bovienii TaxID=40576 RepID=UPI0023B29D6A|nr:hypothetical protein [Xenorhabdus bovienii]MDE9537129.1 hypothetical protein [Xenorhabdus bovienii]MDE9590121.1 hypothetical protein [Xenorhabdus bovienii]
MNSRQRYKLRRKQNRMEARAAAPRTTEEIWDSIIKPVDEIDVLTQLMIGLKKDIKDDNSGSCCMSDVALYSTKQRANRILESGGVTARV